MPVSTQSLVEDCDYNLITGDSSVTLGSSEYSSEIHVSGAGTSINNLVIDSSSNVVIGDVVGWSDFTVHFSKNLYLEKRSNNFLIINGGKTLITWSNEECRWVEYKINSLEKKFKKNLKRKE